jgi:hypothetical protein
VLNSNGDEIMAFFDRAGTRCRCAREQLGLRNWNVREPARARVPRAHR